MQAKPFLKWAGGKSRLLKDIYKSLPKEFINNDFTYVEPFLGSGAVLFWMLNNFPNIKRAIINDINCDLINVYKVISAKPLELISILEIFQIEFYSFEFDVEGRKEYYISKRLLFNSRSANKVTQAALFIFLNRTCFNGLYRVNKSNEFNVPIGSYIKPLICDKENILAVSAILENVEILTGDYEQTLDYINEKSLFYLDPPYKPLNKTSFFNTYANNVFNDEEQIRLRDFCVKLDVRNLNWILSNSDVTLVDSEDTFFDDLYKDFDISRVEAKRYINSDSKKRGNLKELLIFNNVEEQIVLMHN
jgi:DNA adenine methylase